MSGTPEYEIPIDAGRRPAEPDGRHRCPVKVKRILVPTDLTNESHRAIEFGLVLAKPLGAHLTLLHVYQDPAYAVEYVLGPHDNDRAQQERTYFEKTLKATAEDVRKEYAECDSEFRDGVPCEEIVNTAKERDIDLIIISTHHYNWLTRLACGSDAENILRNMPCPILILQANTTPERPAAL
jgi:nucleotide-binding universal stress UspA family protein